MFFIPLFQYDCNRRDQKKSAMLTIGMTGNQLRTMDTTRENTVILWGQDDVLTTAVEDLLGSGRGWKVVRVSDDLDEASLAHALESITPDVLIVHECILASNARLLIKLVQDYSRLKIVTIGLGNNRMQIFNKQTISIESASDLLVAIKPDAPPDE
jgi:hypothetical protein